MSNAGPTPDVDLLEAMLREVCDWFPARRFTLVADGAYVSIANRVTELPVIVISRMRQDAHRFDLPTPNPPHKRGPKPQKGPPLPKPREMAADPATPWKYVQVRRKGKLVLRRVYTRQGIWHAVCPHRPLLLVIVRDPKGHEEDDFFLTTEVASPAQTVVNAYGTGGPLKSPSATANKCSDSKSRNAGGRRDRHVPPAWGSGC